MGCLAAVEGVLHAGYAGRSGYLGRRQGEGTGRSVDRGGGQVPLLEQYPSVPFESPDGTFHPPRQRPRTVLPRRCTPRQEFPRGASTRDGSADEWDGSIADRTKRQGGLAESPSVATSAARVGRVGECQS